MVAPATASAAKLEAAKRMYASSDIAYKLAVRENKKNFPHDAELQFHLKALDVSLLADCLVWIPYHRFTDVTRLGQGGFAAVHKATVQWATKKYFVEYQDMHLGWIWAGRSEPVVKTYAIKEVDVAMAAEPTSPGTTPYPSRAGSSAFPGANPRTNISW
ncbi:hypothetical protein BC936DRAFT_140323 [Jimgerdemannia flammicorona]|uniref:Protein kinase domain-containing protein n=1 Tax=Jimgerdemannia flammicorona TaxID=994334 RepID=A0A433DGY9_9FUNG|nr:hypothetical protein BC936DRAFT_140323 [Jimgerdemannia flammicorona]